MWRARATNNYNRIRNGDDRKRRGVGICNKTSCEMCRWHSEFIGTLLLRCGWMLHTEIYCNPSSGISHLQSEMGRNFVLLLLLMLPLLLLKSEVRYGWIVCWAASETIHNLLTLLLVSIFFFVFLLPSSPPQNLVSGPMLIVPTTESHQPTTHVHHFEWGGLVGCGFGVNEIMSIMCNYGLRTDIMRRKADLCFLRQTKTLTLEESS